MDADLHIDHLDLILVANSLPTLHIRSQRKIVELPDNPLVGIA